MRAVDRHGPVVSDAGELVLVVSDDELTLARATATTRRLIDSVRAADAAHVVVDLTDVQILNSCGVGVLIELNNEATSRGGGVTLRGLRPHARSTLSVLDLLGPAFAVADDPTVE